MGKISVVINTRNEEKNLPRALASVRELADEIVIVDMFSTDNTVAIAKKAGAVVFTHLATGYVEPARNFAIGKATGDWVLVLDADEEVGPDLIKILRRIASGKRIPAKNRYFYGSTPKTPRVYYGIPRKNIIFGKWIRHSRWWPDYNIRFFKKGAVTWREIIHSIPETHGPGAYLEPQEKNALVHYHYDSIEQFVERMNRYTTEHAKLLIQEGYRFSWKDLIKRPTSEFLSRYFSGEGYKDGVHGLALANLQAFSELILYLKIWQHDRFRDLNLNVTDTEEEMKETQREYRWWFLERRIENSTGVKNFFYQIGRSIEATVAFFRILWKDSG